MSNVYKVLKDTEKRKHSPHPNCSTCKGTGWVRTGHPDTEVDGQAIEASEEWCDCRFRNNK